MAKKYFAGRDPIGARFKHGGGDASQNPNPWISVVGVVADVRHNGITGTVKPKFYRPLRSGICDRRTGRRRAT